MIGIPHICMKDQPTSVTKRFLLALHTDIQHNVIEQRLLFIVELGYFVMALNFMTR